MAVIEMRLGRFDEARRRFTNLHELYPEDQQITYMMDESLNTAPQFKAVGTPRSGAQD